MFGRGKEQTEGKGSIIEWHSGGSGWLFAEPSNRHCTAAAGGIVCTGSHREPADFQGTQGANLGAET